MGTRNRAIRVVYFTRRPRKASNFSTESYFRIVRENLPAAFKPVLRVMPFQNKGILKRLGNIVYCFLNQGDINHITGDIHYVAAFLKRRKTILTILDCGMLHFSKGLKHRLFKYFWYKMPAGKSAHITAISQATKQDVVKFTGCDEDKVSVVYVCINPAFTKKSKPFNVDEPRILQIGTAHNKNLERLIPALKGISCKLVVIGKVSNDLHKIIIANNVTCEILDWRLTDEEVREEYYKCDILSFVSTLEGFGMPIVEANAVGRVVITGNVTSMPEVAGNAAHLVDPFSIEDIRTGFIKIINDAAYREQLIENGYKNHSRFSKETITRQFSDLYKKIHSLKEQKL